LLTKIKKERAKFARAAAAKAIESQHKKGPPHRRERIAKLIDPAHSFSKLGFMRPTKYEEWAARSRGTVTGLAKFVAARSCSLP